jgi:hypothetical protein
MVRTMIKTSTRARALGYVDDDQRELYEAGLKIEFPQGVPPEILMTYGPRIGPVASCNAMVGKLPGMRIYGMVPDDAEFRTKGWDEWLVGAIDSLPKRLGVVSAAHNYGSYVNFPWVSAEWINLLGWYFYPKNFHFCCDTILELLGEATRIIYAQPDEFLMFHQGQATINPEAYADATNTFLHWVVNERRQLLEKIRGAMA